MNKLDSYRGVEIHLNDEGKFQAELRGKQRTRASLSSLKKLIDDNSGNLDALLICYSSWRGIGRPRRITITGPSYRHKGDHVMKAADGSVYGDGHSGELIIPFSQEVFDWATDMYEQQTALHERFSDRVSQLQVSRCHLSRLDIMNSTMRDELGLSVSSTDDERPFPHEEHNYERMWNAEQHGA